MAKQPKKWNQVSIESKYYEFIKEKAENLETTKSDILQQAIGLLKEKWEAEEILKREG